MKSKNRMSKFIRSLGVLALLLGAQTMSFPAEAQTPGIVLSALGTGTVDGVISPGEWDNAATVSFNLVTLGDVHPSTLYVMNDDTYLYVAVAIRNEDFKASSFGVQGDVLDLFFDNNHDGGIAFSNSEQGDDFVQLQNGFPEFFLDAFRCLPPVCDFPTFGQDIDFGGSTDTIAAISHTNPSPGAIGDYVYEIAKKLNSGDTDHDFIIAPGQVVGLFLHFVDTPVDSNAGTPATWPGPDDCINFQTNEVPCIGADIMVASQINSLEYFPVVPGTTWKYLVNGKKTMTLSVLNKTVEIRGVETTVFYYLPGGAKEFYTSDSNGIRLHRVAQPDVYIEGLGYIDLSLTFIPPLVFAEEWVEIGQTFESSGIVRTNNLPLVGSIEFPYDASFTFEGFDNVTVPAGSFFNVGVLSGTLTIEGEPESQSLYLAEGLGVIKTTSTIGGNTVNSELVSTNAGYVTLLTPNGGEVIPAGSTYYISWEASVDASYFKLKYSMDDGVTWLPIPGAENVTANDYDWNVPIPSRDKKRCLVKLIGYNATEKKVEADVSDRPFTIATARLTSPNGGETVVPGTYDIKWEIYNTVKPVTRVQLFYTKNGGTTWIPIKTLTGSYGPGPYTEPWNVPLLTTPKAKCMVKVVLKDAKGVIRGSDVSDSFFTIGP